MSKHKELQAVNGYLRNIARKVLDQGITEHSYRGDLQNLLTDLLPQIQIINEPKRQDFGAPDFVLKRGQLPIGYIETKTVGAALDEVERSEQIVRYLNSLDNLILTDFLDFRFFRYGEKVQEVKLAAVGAGKLRAYPELHGPFVDFIKEFAAFTGETISSAEQLAKIMARKARIMEEVILKALLSDAPDQALRQQYEAFRKILIHDLTEATFADIYAQTVAYGMFAARLHDTHPQDFSRFKAAALIPERNPFLRNLFGYIAAFDLDQRIAWVVEALADVFRNTDVAAIVRNSRSGPGDPLIHFYETFLAEYDPAMREKRGVYYTPEPVVRFIVRAVDQLLKDKFGIRDGLADTGKTQIKVKRITKKVDVDVHRVQILDPAAGTGTFLAEVTKHIYHQLQTDRGVWSDYVDNHLIPRLNGFELLMAPYAMAHLKLDLLLEETGYVPTKAGQRLKVYLSNALEEPHPEAGSLFASWLANEANEASFIKRDTPIMVILGNPPYRGHSANRGRWIEQMIEDYKKEPAGGPLQERNPKWLQDDYVKFIRFGEYYIARNQEGILAFINNHAFLDNPTFRGMRWSLLRTFDELFIIDLHGNAKRREVSPDGSPDQNIFDISQGVSINIFVKYKQSKKKAGLAKVYRFDLYGPREHKYRFLEEHTLDQVPFSEVTLYPPYYSFTEHNQGLSRQYEHDSFSIRDLFPASSPGLVTARDHFSIHFTKESLINATREFLSLSVEQARERFGLGRDTKEWTVAGARSDLLAIGPSPDHIIKLAYRPFDDRYTYYTGRSKGYHCRPRRITNHFLQGSNLGLVTVRRQLESMPTAYYFVTKHMISNGFIRSDSVSIDYVFPLYIYAGDLPGHWERTPNLNGRILSVFEERLGLKFVNEPGETTDTFAPLDVFNYVYAWLHSPSYRARFAEVLKRDFPRVPYPWGREEFWELVRLGDELRKAHLMEDLDTGAYAGFQQPGSGLITDVRYDGSRVWINDRQFFDNVPETAWNFHIGGYQPAQKWLKDRKQRTLGFDDVRHYQRIIAALMATDRLMCAIDQVVEA